MGMKVNGTSGLTFPDTTTLGSAGQSSVQAWVNFNGTGTVAIRANFNVASITDNGTGDYTVNFTNALVDANYSIVGTAQYPPSSGSAVPLVGPNRNTPLTANSARINTTNTADIVVDLITVSVAIFR